jgi:hypothetical protein
MDIPRQILKEIHPDQRWIKAMEQLLSFGALDLSYLNSAIASINNIALSALAAAQLALDKNCGEFYSTIDQSGLDVNMPTPATFNVVRYANGISLNGSRITVNKTGTYKFSFRVQL